MTRDARTTTAQATADRHQYAPSENVDDGGPFFPIDAVPGTALFLKMERGASFRDWFAGQALVGAIHREGIWGNEAVAAHRAYEFADAMLRARATPEKE